MSRPGVLSHSPVLFDVMKRLKIKVAATDILVTSTHITAYARVALGDSLFDTVVTFDRLDGREELTHEEAVTATQMVLRSVAEYGRDGGFEARG